MKGQVRSEIIKIKEERGSHLEDAESTDRVGIGC
jgi:hypothetical protein